MATRYRWIAPLYDVVAGEPVYGVGRRAAIAALGLSPGDRVLDLGCGTGLNVPGLLAAVGPEGRVVGVDRSSAMLDVARRRRGDLGPLSLVRADIRRLDRVADPALSPPGGFDAMLATYALSLVDDWPAAWRAARARLRPGASAAVVDMAVPTGRGRPLAPLARVACRLGGGDIEAHPWTAVETEAVGTRGRSLRGGHVQVRVGTLL